MLGLDVCQRLPEPARTCLLLSAKGVTDEGPESISTLSERVLIGELKVSKGIWATRSGRGGEHRGVLHQPCNKMKNLTDRHSRELELVFIISIVLLISSGEIPSKFAPGVRPLSHVDVTVPEIQPL
jgi:hypothetical protein